MKTLEFNGNVCSMDLDTLGRTSKFDEIHGLTDKRPVQHVDFIRSLQTLCEENQILCDLSPIHASKKQALLVNWNREQHGIPPVENFLIQRLITQLNLIHPEDTDKRVNIALCYNEKGIECAFGTRIDICANQNIFGGHRMRTYGNDRMSYDEMMQKLQDWLINYEDMRAENYEKINRMMQTELRTDQTRQIIGDLIYLAVTDNMPGKSVNAPLNQVQVSNLIQASHLPMYQKKGGEPVTVWDVTQWGTHGLKAENNMDLLTLQETQQGFNTFMLDNYASPAQLN